MTRNPRLIVTKNGHLYIGHDNGCFDFVVKEHGLVAAYTIASPELTPARLSDAFGGVDLIGPAAAKLASGFPIEKVGPSEDSYEPKLRAIRHEVNRRLRRIEASVLHVDKFGNATTNIQKQDLDDIGLGVGDELAVEIGGRFFLVPLERIYGDVPAGNRVALLYEGLLQLAVNEGNFAELVGATQGLSVFVTARR